MFLIQVVPIHINFVYSNVIFLVDDININIKRRMESVKMRTWGGIAKVMGIVFCAGGALTIAFFKGPTMKLLMHHHLFSYHGQVQNSAASGNTWIKGVFLMLLANALWATWLVMQVSCVYIILFHV